MAEILLADDERMVRKSMRAMLTAEGYAVRTARNGDEALSMLDESVPDLVVLDIMMSGRNGFSTCEEMRRRHPLLPILLLTALDDNSSKIRGLGVGADDYIHKAADPSELLARIRRALARAEAYRTAAPSTDELRLGKVTVDLARHTVRNADGETERLTTTESDLLKLLASSRGRYFTNDEIAVALRGEGFAVESTTIRVHVCKLKNKLSTAGELIVNSPRSGYALL